MSNLVIDKACVYIFELTDCNSGIYSGRSIVNASLYYPTIEYVSGSLLAVWLH